MDVIFLTSTSIDLILAIKRLLKTTFEMSEIGDRIVALYLQAECVHVPQGIFMSQRGYCQQILELFGMQDTHLVSTPMIE